MDAMASPDDGYSVDPDELMTIVSTLSQVGADLSNGLQKVRDGLLLPQDVGQGWEVDSPLAGCATDWVEQTRDLAAAISQASENLAKTAQSYLDAEGGFSSM